MFSFGVIFPEKAKPDVALLYGFLTAFFYELFAFASDLGSSSFVVPRAAGVVFDFTCSSLISKSP